MQTTPLIDSRPVAQTFALRREVVPAASAGPSVVLEPGQAYGSVLRDRSGAWTMWYLGRPHYCEYLATSEGGIAWRRPALDLVHSAARAQANGPNAFMAPGQRDAAGRWLVHDKGPEGFCVLDATLTPHPAARARYTALYLARGHEGGLWHKGLCLAHSDDGVRWLADERNPVIPGWRDTANLFLYDLRLRRYVWYGRPEAHVALGHEANRLVARSVSEDLAAWEPERTVLDTDDADADPLDLVDELAFRDLPAGADALARARAAAEITEGLPGAAAPVKPLIRGRTRQWYGITVFPCADLYLGLGWLYDVPSGEIWVELLHSFDGIDWRREARRAPFLPHTPGDIRVTMSSPPVAIGDEVWIYSSSSGRNHHQRALPGRTDAVLERHVVRRDRWVGYSAGSRPGELLTQPLKRGPRIALNLRTGSGGAVRVEVLSAAGGKLEGFSLDACAPLTGDALAAEPTWSGGRTAADIPAHHETIRLRIVLANAALFALEA